MAAVVRLVLTAVGAVGTLAAIAFLQGGTTRLHASLAWHHPVVLGVLLALSVLWAISGPFPSVREGREPAGQLPAPPAGEAQRQGAGDVGAPAARPGPDPPHRSSAGPKAA